MTEMKRVAILGIDNLSRKNRAQLIEMNRRGYAFDVFTSDQFGDSAENLPPGNTVHYLEPSPFARLRQLSSYFSAHRRTLNHIEAYPGGRFAGMYYAIARRFSLPVVVVERGDLLYRNRYSSATRASMWVLYRGADVVWYREPYQERVLRAIGVNRLFFLANAIAPHGNQPPVERNLDFIWINRLMVERRADWVAELLAEDEFKNTNNLMKGFLDNLSTTPGIEAAEQHIREICPPNLTLEGYAHPGDVYERARFFLLPSSVVFCNNALLEAMSHGVVPIISDVEGSRLIVDDGVNGFVVPHTKEALRQGMSRALGLTHTRWLEMSRAAMDKVRDAFGIDAWADSLETLYSQLGSTSEAAPRVAAG